MLHPLNVGNLWHEDDGQDAAEYAIIMAVLLVLAIGVVKLIGNNSTQVFSEIALKTGS
jgi:Flp pilus assembly pilin Flp